MSPFRPELVPRRLDQALARLRPIERDVLLLCSGDHLTIAEAALCLGISLEQAEHHLAKALSRLDRDLERDRRPWWRFW